MNLIIRKLNNIILALSLCFALIFMQGCGKDEIVDENALPVADNITFSTYNQFALELLKSTRNTDENIIISPLSIGLIMTMLRMGAAGDTALGIDEALSMTVEDFDIAMTQCAQIVASMENLDENIWYETGTGLFIDEGPSIKESYAVDVESNFNLLIDFMNFDNERSETEINDWADISTSGRVEKFIGTDELPHDLITLLLNVNAMDCVWQIAFDSANTRPLAFMMGENKGVSVPMMRGKINIKIYEDENVLAGFIPLDGGKTSLAIIMPPTDKQLSEFIETLTAEDIELWRLIAPEGEQYIRLPKINWDKPISFKDALTAMGAGLIFDSENADFSTMGNGFFLGDIIQTTIVKATESGAAESTVTASDLIRAQTNEEYFFSVDRPFLIAAIDNETGGIFMIGTVVNPLS